MKQIPLVKLFLLGLCTMTLGIYSYYVAVSLKPPHYVFGQAKWVEVSAAAAKLRQEPTVESELIRKLASGQRLQLLDEQDNWLQVEDNEGDIGWVYRLDTVYSPPGLK